MTISRETFRSRSIRECILRLAFNTFAENPDVGILMDHIFQGFTTGMVRYRAEEIEAELADLIERGMVKMENSSDRSPIPEKLFRITARGRDFVRSKFPWMRIDEFNVNE